MTGQIQKVTDRGYGFISVEDEEDDIFFHANALVDELEFNSLNEGDEVTFEIEETDKGPSAVNVSLA